METLAAQASMPPGLTSAQVVGFVLLDIAIILVVARLMGALARKVGQPTVVGEIIAGVLLGPSLLGATVYAWDNPWGVLNCDKALEVANAPDQASITACFFPAQSVSVLGIIGQLALVLFMFLVGLELDTSRLKGKFGGITAVSLGVIGLPIALGFVIGPVLYTERFVAGFGTPAEPSTVAFAMMVGAMLAVTAFPVMARILQEKNLSSSAMGSIGIAAAAAVTVLMFLAVSVAASTARGDEPSALILTFVYTAVYIAVLFFVVRPLLAPMGRSLEANGMTPGVFAIMLIVTFGSSYVAHQIGINVIVGAFLAGAIMPAREVMLREMGSRLSEFTVVILLPIFLAFSGLQTDFTVLRTADIVGILLFLVAGIAGKWAGGAIFSRLGGLSWAEGNVIGVLMNCRGLLILVVALVAVNAGVISPALQVGGVLMALLTTMMTGPLMDRFLPTLPADAAAPPDREVVSEHPPDTHRVLAVVDGLDNAPLVARAAFSLTTGHAPAEVVLCRVIRRSSYDELPSDAAGALEVAQSGRSLKLMGTMAPEGVGVVPIAFSSIDPDGDITRMARERNCAVTLVGYGHPRSGQLVERLLADGHNDVIVQPNLDETPDATGPVTVAAAPDDDVTPEIGRQLADGLGVAVERLEAHDDETALVEASRRSSLLVTTAEVPGAACPVYVVRRTVAAPTG